MQDLKYLGFGVSAGAVYLVVCLLQLLSEGHAPKIQALLQQDIAASVPQRLTAHQYIDQMMTWPSQFKRKTSTIASAESR
jgi:hypothetical protein